VSIDTAVCYATAVYRLLVIFSRVVALRCIVSHFMICPNVFRASTEGFKPQKLGFYVSMIRQGKDAK